MKYELNWLRGGLVNVKEAGFTCQKQVKIVIQRNFIIKYLLPRVKYLANDETAL
jgi:hypothetical protein